MAVSVALIREENRAQLPIYYVSQAFQGAEVKYPRMEKIVFALIVASRKLCLYFKVNPILVMTNQPIKKAMNKPKAIGRLVQWAIKLSQFDIKYCPRTAIKAQALADFITKFTLSNNQKTQDGSKSLTVLTDGSSIQKRCGVGVIINTPEGETLRYGVRLQFLATNNEAKYKTILTKLRIEKALRAKHILLKSDSKLVIGQIKGEYEAKEGRKQKYLKLTNQLVQEYDQVDFIQVPQNQNLEADEMARQALLEERTGSPNLKVEL